MKLGLLADIHEELESLRTAIDRLRTLGAERFVMLGDVFDRGDVRHLDDATALLDGLNAVGVWGNHDFGLCHPDGRERARYTPRTLAYMSRLRPRLEIDGCLFTHIEPHLDPTLLEDLWTCEGHPDTPERVAPSFAAAHHRLMLHGPHP